MKSTQTTLPFGQRSQLYWDLLLGESFELLRRIYQIEPDVYKDNIKKLTEVLKLDKFIHTPVRHLSLGQRMCGDLAAAMLVGSPRNIKRSTPSIRTGFMMCFSCSVVSFIAY
ncbi:hypothetical protein [Paenibacillus radicis (ex Xue et al. 2023)]|uniref:Uncharacterized protein n=1 Tax=Paenibacillus radicis (ex Xue et al. 2023) TaxID=2972489 RepID=A0ABT1YJ44_9BACL|nr:hypothetical protein [Paenibacillus radicis (ex Xue et al. 2023)]MCR8633189.1 hypothetical protein [Paenibacillus radicis (ex Xue et al. 2023)]